ncbi:MFS transporter [Cryptosporangium arvum]|uniref:Drug resistance transporter, EmrB/QacA subfamily n=1 Tax=Cryptosporangium arvum DSM 44712 TaxID=927661 RepID=A0A011AEJ7_9ACTN|nr:MFS transporter [Cryptosporangium arvum]EXG80461.1 drug resistance transporter, EmrB/QacA subfamily [Cryptosporangium arvum DSM 44712]
MTAGPATAQRWAVAVTALAGLLVTLDALVVTTALGAIRAAFDTSAEALEWTVTAYVLTFAVLLMPGTALGDRFGRRRVFVAGLVTFAVASAACALAPTVGALIAARAFQGAGAALVMPLALALLSTAVPPDRRAGALGIFTGVTGVAVPLGPLLGGAVVSGISWAWIFWINVPVVAVLVVLASTRLTESFGPRNRTDPVALLLVAGAALGLVWGLVRGNAAGWTSVEVLSSLVAGVLLVVGFAGWQRRAAEPLVPADVLGSRAFVVGAVAIFLQWGSVLGALFFMAQFLQDGLGFSPLRAGLGLVPWGATTFLVPPIAGHFIGRVGVRPFIVAGLGLHAAAMVWIAVIVDPGLGYGQLIAPLVVSGTGVALALPATQAAALSGVGPGSVGAASGAYSTMRQLGGVFGVAVVVSAFLAAGSYASPRTFATGFAAALAACAALSLVGALTGLVAPRSSAPAARPVVTGRVTAS